MPTPCSRSAAASTPPAPLPVPPRDLFRAALERDRPRESDAFATGPVIPIPVPRPWRQALVASRRGYDHSWIGALAFAALILAGDAGWTAPVAHDAMPAISLSSGD